MRTLLFTLISLGCSLAVAATVYKWVDENGVVHYSDQPHPNAEKVQVKEPQTFKALPTPSTASAPGIAAPAAPATNAPVYQGCAVTQPADGEDYSNITSLNAVVRTDPPLHPGDQVFLTLDGQPLNGGRATGPQFTISPVDRGTHTLQATVRGADGALMCQTPGITFNVHQPSLLNPANPVRPH
jgi:Domain of unknown function (DUF4124)